MCTFNIIIEALRLHISVFFKSHFVFSYIHKFFFDTNMSNTFDLEIWYSRQNLKCITKYSIHYQKSFGGHGRPNIILQ